MRVMILSAPSLSPSPFLYLTTSSNATITKHKRIGRSIEDRQREREENSAEMNLPIRTMKNHNNRQPSVFFFKQMQERDPLNERL